MERLTAQQLKDLLERPDSAATWLARLGVTQPRRASDGLARIAANGLPLDVLAELSDRLARWLPATSDPDMALLNLERFLFASRSPLAVAALFLRDAQALPILLQLLSTSQYLSDLLVQQPETYDLLRMTEGAPVSRELLIEEFRGELQATRGKEMRMQLLRSLKRRETARIIYGDIVRGQRIETITRQISLLAEALCQVSYEVACADMEEAHGVLRAEDGPPPGFAILALGKLGGQELNYSSDIDLLFLSSGGGKSDGPRPLTSPEYFLKLAQRLIRLLGDVTDAGFCYRVDMRLRPDGAQGPLVADSHAARIYYENKGRTWERQALVKARPIAGDLRLGAEVRDALWEWVYQGYLNRAEIADIQALKRRMERRAAERGIDATDVKTGHGGIRDIEFVIQFLQLLHGADLPALRTTQTLEAISQLERCGCLTLQERSLLEENYAFLRRTEHRLQILFDLQTHRLPTSSSELAKLAKRMEIREGSGRSSAEAFVRVHREKTEANRRILNHLLHDAFAAGVDVDPEADVILDPAPDPTFVQETLAPYGLRAPLVAAGHLNDLADEKQPFLSTRRCRHFLAAIARRLLTEIARTPDPDAALVRMGQVADSLGGKGVLWELLSESPPALRMFVRLCAGSSYLSSILIANPGMIDELLDSLLLQRLPNQEAVVAESVQLCRNAEDIVPILHGFKNASHLTAGVREMLHMDPIRETTRYLADVAEACVSVIAAREWEAMVERWGAPQSSLVIVAMGKFGGRELNYHSDLDIIFLFTEEGHTARTTSGDTTTHQHFFGELAQRIVRSVNHLSPWGRLFEMDARLRPTGINGPLATSFAAFARYFASGTGQLWERMALCKARPIFGPPQRAWQLGHSSGTRCGPSPGTPAIENTFEICDAALRRRPRRTI